MSRREELSDADLLDAFVRGDADAFATLVRRHEDRLFAICLGVTRNRADALDAVQDSFLAVFRKAATFRGESAFSTWLYQVAVNASRDLLRKKARRDAKTELEVVPDSAVQVEDGTVRRMDVAAALSEIPEQYRDAVVMHDLGGMAYEEIAAVLGVPDGTVKSRISRGRRHLARLLEQHSQRSRHSSEVNPESRQI